MAMRAKKGRYGVWSSSRQSIFSQYPNMMKVKEQYNGEVLYQDEGHCECLGVVDEGTQQQAAVQHLQNLD